MKRIFTAFSLLLTCGVAAAEDEPPKNFRVSAQFITMPHTVMTGLLAGEETEGSKLHEKAFALTKDGKAKLMETSMVVCRSGDKATVESVREEIFPVEYHPAKMIWETPLTREQMAKMPETPRHPSSRYIGAFETRNLGTSFVVEAMVSDRSIALLLQSEIVGLLHMENWMDHQDRWGDASMRFPIFEIWRTNTSFTVRSGKFALVSAITPKRQLPAPFVDSRILLFVRADVLETP